MSETVLEARGLSYRIGANTLVRDVTFDLKAGELHVVAGPNGAGKSTLLRLLTGELRPSAGTITMGSHSLASLGPGRLARMRAVMTQATHIAFPYSALDIVRLGMEGFDGLSRAARDTMASAALETVQLADLAGRDYQTLSGGEQQRVQFARAIGQLRAGAGQAAGRILFLDEPVSSLDLRHQLGLMAQAHRIAREGIAVLAILHDLNLAATFADRLTILSSGAVVAAGAVETVITQDMLADVFGVRLTLHPSGLAGRQAVLPQRWMDFHGEGAD